MVMDISRERQWEGRLWTITQLLMSAAVLWGASTLWELSKSVARIDAQLSNSVAVQQLTSAAQTARDKSQDEANDSLRRLVDEIRAEVYRNRR
jgi:hypothetical protein